MFREERIAGPGGIDLAAGVFTRGRREVALVLLHQIGGAGLCGWGTFATAAARSGLASVAIDMCGYGDSECSERATSDPAAQVDAAAGFAREQLGARRVVVVGASMGGSQAVRAVAAGAEVDAWVDVSGPSAWDGQALLDVADDVDRPGMVVYAKSDGIPEYRKARTLANRVGAEFVDGGAGHGWQLLTRIDGDLTATSRRLLRFATG